MKYSYAVFDMDGTILYTLDDLRDALNRALHISGYPERTLDEVRRFIGNGVKVLIRRAAPQDITEEQYQKLLADFREWYNVHCADNTRPYDGIVDAIRELREKGVKTAVVSNKSDGGVKMLCKEFFHGLFDAEIGTREDKPSKPAPDLVWEALALLGADRSEAVYIGDTEVDLQTAQNSGLDFLGVDWGFRGTDALRALGVTDIAQKPNELIEFII